MVWRVESGRHRGRQSALEPPITWILAIKCTIIVDLVSLNDLCFDFTSIFAGWL